MTDLSFADVLMQDAYEMRKAQKVLDLCDIVVGRQPGTGIGNLEREIGILESSAWFYSGLTPKEFERRYSAFGSGYGFQEDYEPPRTDAYGANFSY